MNNEGFIPRARARGHARTLRARALYGMAQEWIHVGLDLSGGIPASPGPALGQLAQGPASLAPAPASPVWA